MLWHMDAFLTSSSSLSYTSTALQSCLSLGTACRHSPSLSYQQHIVCRKNVYLLHALPCLLGTCGGQHKEPEIAHNLNSYLMFFIGWHYIAFHVSLNKITIRKQKQWDLHSNTLAFWITDLLLWQCWIINKWRSAWSSISNRHSQ